MVGDVVVVPFPFTNLSEVKLRPAVVLADVGMGDWILCEVTSRRRRRSGDIEIATNDLENGALERDSWARPGRLHALNESLFRGTIAHLKETKLVEILSAARKLF